MTGDNRIGLKISGVARPAHVRPDEKRTTTSAPMRAVMTNDPVAVPQLISLAADIASQPPPIDSARIAPIREAIANGSYVVSPEATARAMFQFFGRGDGV